MVVVRAGEPKDAFRFVLAIAGIGRVGASQSISGLEESGLPIFLTTFDPSGAQWMQQWLAVPSELRRLIVWDSRLNRCIEIEGAAIDRHSAGPTSDGRQDRYTVRGTVKVIERPEWLVSTMSSPAQALPAVPPPSDSRPPPQSRDVQAR